MHVRRVLALATAAISPAWLAACGGDDTTADSPTGASGNARVIELAMTEMAFSPATIEVSRGESVVFRFRNDGQVIHEAVIGDENEQLQHGTSMSSTPMGDHDMGTDEEITVEPGKTGELHYTFPDAGSVLIGCHQPGHYEAGMQATVNVS